MPDFFLNVGLSTIISIHHHSIRTFKGEARASKRINTSQKLSGK